MEDVVKIDVKTNDDEVKQIRENHGSLFKNEQFWDAIEVTILNVEYK